MTHHVQRPEKQPWSWPVTTATALLQSHVHCILHTIHNFKYPVTFTCYQRKDLSRAPTFEKVFVTPSLICYALSHGTCLQLSQSTSAATKPTLGIMRISWMGQSAQECRKHNSLCCSPNCRLLYFTICPYTSNLKKNYCKLRAFIQSSCRISFYHTYPRRFMRP